MKKSFFLLCLALSATILPAQGFRGRPMSESRWMEHISATPVTGAPFSAVETVQIQHMLANGNQINRNVQCKVFRDSQGRMRRERTVTPPAASGRQPFTEVTIVDPVAGFRYVLNPSNMTAFKSPLPQSPASASAGTSPAGRAARMMPEGTQVSTTDLGTQTINGMQATGKQVTETIPAGAIGNQQPIQVVRVIWTSTDLKVPVQVKSTDPRFGTSDRELTNITKGEPDASLFAVPSNYTVKTREFTPGGHARPGREE